MLACVDLCKGSILGNDRFGSLAFSQMNADYHTITHLEMCENEKESDERSISLSFARRCLIFDHVLIAP